MVSRLGLTVAEGREHGDCASEFLESHGVAGVVRELMPVDGALSEETLVGPRNNVLVVLAVGD